MTRTALAVAAASWGVLMGVSPLLQIRRMLRERSSRDVSLGYFAILLVGFVLWMAYGIASADLALILPNGVALLVASATVVVALRLRSTSSSAAAPEEDGPQERDR